MKTIANLIKPLALIIMPPLAVMLCLLFIDGPVATAIWNMTSAYPGLTKRFNGLPNLLTAAVLLCTTALWLVYALVHRSKIMASFLRLAATAVPLAFIMKIVLQHAFGHTSVRMWLQEGLPIAFRPFHPIRTGGFPSGHSLVLAAFLTAVWLYFPRLRIPAAVLMCGLAAGLLVTSYHFVSDIVAGIWCGILLTVCLQRVLDAGDGRVD